MKIENVVFPKKVMVTFINTLYNDAIRCSNDKCKVIKKGSSCIDNENTVIERDKKNI